MITIRREICRSCGACVSVCPHNALELFDAYLNHDAALCREKCGFCIAVCPLGAISEER
ncbi:MAG: 4Fe-4S binding protein [Methanocorpusculum sp.]|nr:4Fe-4S binding protein [Methanocorpusculum sp.]